MKCHLSLRQLYKIQGNATDAGTKLLICIFAAVEKIIIAIYVHMKIFILSKEIRLRILKYCTGSETVMFNLLSILLLLFFF